MSNPHDSREPIDPSLDDTVADEDAIDPVEPAAPPPPPPPPPVFREERAELEDHYSHRPAEPPPQPIRRPPPVPERASQRRWREDLGDTPGLQDSRMGAIRSGDVERLHLDDIYDRPEQISTAAVADYDPEAGRTHVAVRIQAVRQVVRNATSTPFGRLVVAIPLGLISLTTIIMAITIQDRWMWVTALLLTPPAAYLLYVRYQAWLGHKRYMYRLLESLGEDVSDFEPTRTYRRVGKSMRK